MRSTRQYSPHTNAVTILEVLVVMTIIAVLTAIVYPVFVMARSKSRESQCLQQMRQIVMAIRMYQQDHDGTEFGNTPAAMGLPPQPYQLVSSGYIRSSEILRCPNRFIDPFWFQPGNDNDRVTSYAISYISFGRRINFPYEYQRNPAFPIISCEYHNHLKNELIFIGTGLNGGVTRKALLKYSSPTDSTR
jgi:prepilin-type N-terminal cleavage/methylation domain-containing protein